MSQIPQRREHPVKETLCLNCGGGSAPGATFCQWCGQSFTEGYTAPTKQQQAPAPTQTNSCLGTTLFLFGLVGIIGSLLITVLDLSGANVFQAQSVISFGLLMVIGSFLLLMLPGILIMRKK